MHLNRRRFLALSGRSIALSGSGLLVACQSGPQTRDGSLKWKSPVFGSIYSSPALDAQGTLYIGSSIEHVLALDSTSGAPLADYNAGAAVWSAPSIRPDGTLVVADRSGRVLVLAES